MFPIGVGQTISRPGISSVLTARSPRAPSPRRRSSRRRARAPRRRPASRSSAAARAREAPRGPARAAGRPPPSTPPPITITSGSKMLAKLESATPRRRPIVATTSIAISSPPSAASVTARPSISSPSARALPSAESGCASAATRPSRPSAVPGGDRLDAAVVRAVALARRAVDVDDDVAELGAGAGRAAVELAAEDQPAADPGPDRQHDHVGASRAGAEAVLGERRDVGVVVDEDRQPEALADQVADRDVDDRQVDGADRDPALAVDRARDPEPDRRGLRTGVDRASRISASSSSSSSLERAAEGARRWPGWSTRCVGVDHADEHLRPAEVDADRRPHVDGRRQEFRAGHEVFDSYDDRPRRRTRAPASARSAPSTTSTESRARPAATCVRNPTSPGFATGCAAARARAISRRSRRPRRGSDRSGAGC